MLLLTIHSFNTKKSTTKTTIMSCLRNLKRTESAPLTRRKTLKTTVWILWRKEIFIMSKMMAIIWMRKTDMYRQRHLGIIRFLKVISGFSTTEINSLFPSSSKCPKAPTPTKINYLYSTRPIHASP